MATVPEIPGVLGVLRVLAPSIAGTGCRTTPPPAAAGTTPPPPWMLSHKIQIPKQIIAHLWSCPQRTCWHFNWRVLWPIPTVQKPTCAICTASKSGASGCETEGLSFHCERKTIKSSISANIWRSSSDVQDMMWQPNHGGYTMGDNRHIHLHHKLQTWQWVYTTSTRLPLPLYQHHHHGKTTMSDEDTLVLKEGKNEARPPLSNTKAQVSTSNVPNQRWSKMKTPWKSCPGTFCK